MSEPTIEQTRTTPPERQLLTGWGRTAPSAADVHRVHDSAEVVDVVATATPRGTIARGLARSYGDAAQVAGGAVLDLTGMDRVLDLDLATGLVTAEAGLSLDRLMRLVLPFGWFVPVTPGTRFVTLGGSFAGDIHGKNHHLDGSFASQVRWFDMVTADASTRRFTPEADPEVFWATAGGMGLTGAITAMQLQLIPVTSAWMRVDTERATDLDDLLDRLTTADHRYHYSVAWIDCAASGASMGRGVLTRGWHADAAELSGRAAHDPLHFDPSTRLRAPAVFPPGLLNRATVSAFNEVWYRKAPAERRDEIQRLATFFHPLDGVAEWNRIYGPRGFLQYQFVVGLDQVEVLRECVERISSSGLASFLAVLKRFGPGNPGPLSFPMEGWTLALDFPNVPELAPLLDRLDHLVLDAAGRIYLAKDARLPAEHLPAMYPRLDEFRAVRDKLDPTGVFSSDISRRLRL